MNERVPPHRRIFIKFFKTQISFFRIPPPVYSKRHETKHITTNTNTNPITHSPLPPPPFISTRCSVNERINQNKPSSLYSKLFFQSGENLSRTGSKTNSNPIFFTITFQTQNIVILQEFANLTIGKFFGFCSFPTNLQHTSVVFL